MGLRDSCGEQIVRRSSIEREHCCWIGSTGCCKVMLWGPYMYGSEGLVLGCLPGGKTSTFHSIQSVYHGVPPSLARVELMQGEKGDTWVRAGVRRACCVGRQWAKFSVIQRIWLMESWDRNDDRAESCHNTTMRFQREISRWAWQKQAEGIKQKVRKQVWFLCKDPSHNEGI